MATHSAFIDRSIRRRRRLVLV